MTLPRVDRKALQSAFCLAHHAALHYEIAGAVLTADFATAVAPYTDSEAKLKYLRGAELGH